MTEPWLALVIVVILRLASSKLSAEAPLLPVIRLTLMSVSSLVVRLSALMSATAFTTWSKVALPALKLVLPPLVATLMRLPLVTDVGVSIVTMISPGVMPLKSAVGTNRSRSVAARLRADVSEFVLLMVVHEPLPLWYCHTPLAVFSV